MEEDHQHQKLTKKLKGAGMTMWYLKTVLAQNQRKTLLLLTIAFVQISIGNLWINI